MIVLFVNQNGERKMAREKLKLMAVFMGFYETHKMKVNGVEKTFHEIDVEYDVLSLSGAASFVSDVVDKDDLLSEKKFDELTYLKLRDFIRQHKGESMLEDKSYAEVDAEHHNSWECFNSAFNVSVEVMRHGKDRGVTAILEGFEGFSELLYIVLYEIFQRELESRGHKVG